MPVVNEIGPIARAFGNILAAEPVSHGALTVIPMLAPMLSEPRWLTLIEAGDKVRITSRRGGGAPSSGPLAANQPLLLLDGEDGGRQARPRLTTMRGGEVGYGIPVSPSGGALGYRGRHFASGDASPLCLGAPEGRPG
jgi:hypothetical protein